MSERFRECVSEFIRLNSVSSNDVQLLITVMLFKQRNKDGQNMF